ncbi:MAG: CHC2 zinc finger domain-containing protein [Brevinema sp.]
MYDVKDYPFDIRDVVQLLGLQIKHRNPSSWDTNCPFCGNRKGKLNINTTKNVYRCNYCGESGGMLALYGKVYNLTNREAYDEIVQSLHLGTNAPEYQVPEKKKIPEEELTNAERADDKVIHQTYMRLLDLLTLTDHHRKDLRSRGLTDEQMEKHLYRSTPLFAFKQLTAKLIAEGYTVQGVPGFYMLKDGSWSMNVSVKNGGFFVPVISIDGLIQGMQIRLDKPYEGMKYIWFSSVNKVNGVTSGSPVHFIGNPSSVVYITEGSLKGNIAHELSGNSMLCTAGVNHYKHLSGLLQQLKSSGVRYVFESYDMDKLQRPVCRADYSEECIACAERQLGGSCYKKQRKLTNIQKGCMHVYEICEELELSCTRLVWDVDENGIWRERVKGIDDHYVDQM